MAEVLSQNEIDALLSALTTGEVDAEELKQEQSKKKVRVYDFRRPNKFSKDQIHTLHVINESYSRGVGTFLSALTRLLVQIEVLSVEQITYDEFVRSVPTPTMLGLFSLPPLEGTCIMEINPTLGFVMLDRLLGGSGQAPDKIRSLTEIEETVMERVMQRMLDHMIEPWSSIVELEPYLDGIENNPQFIQIISPSEMVVIISLEAKIADTIGVINICVPYLVLEPILDKLSVHYYYSTGVREQKKENREQINHRLQATPIPIRIILGKSVISVGELLDLSVGDVISLDRKSRQPLEMVIGQKPKFLGKPGVIGNNMALEITHVLEEESDNE